MTRAAELYELRREVCRANRLLSTRGLVALTWGNVSGIDAARERVVIKPSGLPYDELTPDRMVVLDIRGSVVEGDLRPSTDAPTHLRIYREFDTVGGVAHTHSVHATMFAQARKPIPCLGTTHADHWFGDVPVTRQLTADEVTRDYEGSVGTAIIECMSGRSARSTPGVLVAGHAPFTWGKNAFASLEHAVALEAIAQMAIGTFMLDPSARCLEEHLSEKHYLRKHGENAYYGQARTPPTSDVGG